MGHRYQAVQWSPFKRRYDLVIALAIALYLVVFAAVTILSAAPAPGPHPVQLAMRATGSLAFLMLTAVLMIGPLARLTPRAAPLLFNRRHLGVATFLVALVHAGLVIFWYAAGGPVGPARALFESNANYGSVAGFPFEVLGLAALVILFLLAATSHDLWQAVLGARAWKWLHMLVYVGYALLVVHIVLGAMQTEKGLAYPVLLAVASGLLVALHVGTGLREWARIRPRRAEEGWLPVGPASALPQDRALIVTPPRGERIAVFRHGGGISAISNVCRHQGGPLGEGRIVEGCVTCPWHGWQYRPEDGRAPPPFTERIATYRVRVSDGMVFVHELPLAPGTAVTPARPTEKAP